MNSPHPLIWLARSGSSIFEIIIYIVKVSTQNTTFVCIVFILPIIINNQLFLVINNSQLHSSYIVIIGADVEGEFTKCVTFSQ